jgi:GT2 family glycosyltransferase
MAAPNVAIVIVNWKGLQDTLACVESCLELDYPEFSVVVVDNGSDDGSAQRLEEVFGANSRVTVITCGSNLGFAAGNNRGIDHARSAGSSCYWLLNNDTEVHPRALIRLVEALTDGGNVGIVGSMIHYYDRPGVIWFAGGEIRASDGAPIHIGEHELDVGQYDGVHPSEFVTGCSLLISGEAIDLIGPMSEDYFLYWEDVDWCFRARSAGLEAVVQPASLVRHKVGESTEGNPRVQSRYITRNSLIFFRRNVRGGTLKVGLSALRHGLGALLRGRTQSGLGILEGIRDFMLGRTGKIVVGRSGSSS